jgi:hypothetical protein
MLLSFRKQLSEEIYETGNQAFSLRLRFLTTRASDRFAILQKHEGNILIVSTVDALGEIAGSFGDGYTSFLHESDYRII